MNFRTRAVEHLSKPVRINEAQAPPFPHDWKAGFRGNNEYMIGGGGSEEPYLKNNQWVLYVYNKRTGKHELYNYSTDMFELAESTITESAIPADTRARMLMAVTAYDRRRENKPGYNPYALPQYCAALQLVDKKVAAGDTLRVAITSSFIDRLQDAVLKAAGLPKGTTDELRGWGPRSKLRESTVNESQTRQQVLDRLEAYYQDLVKRIGVKAATYADDLMISYERGESLNTAKPSPVHNPRDQAATIRKDVEHIITNGGEYPLYEKKARS